MLLGGDLRDHQQEAADRRDPEPVQAQRVRHEVRGQLQDHPSDERVGEEHQAEGATCTDFPHPTNNNTDQPQDDCNQHEAAERRPREVIQVDSAAVAAERQPVHSIEEHQQDHRDEKVCGEAHFSLSW